MTGTTTSTTPRVGTGSRPLATPAARRSVARQGTPARQNSVREHNLALVLARIVEARTPLTRAQVASSTGLTRATVSDLVETLLEAQLVTELAPRVGDGAGRPGVPLAPAPHTIVGVGAEVAVDHLGVTVVDLSGLPVSQRIVEGDFRSSDPDRVLGKLAGLLTAVVTEVTSSGMRPGGICVAAPGLLEHPSSILRFAPNLGWTDVPLVDALRAATGFEQLRWRCGNDADFAARAECHARARASDAPGTEQNFVYIGGFVGIGGAIVRQGRLMSGINGWGGEIGHSPVHPEGPLCSCGARGCLEQFAGRPALLRRAGLSPAEPLDAMADLAASSVREAGAARAALREAASALGCAAATMVNLVDVQTVVLGGFYGPLFESVAEQIRTELDRRVLGARWQPISLEPAVVTEWASLRGAALTILEGVLEMPTSWDRESVTIP